MISKIRKVLIALLFVGILSASLALSAFFYCRVGHPFDVTLTPATSPTPGASAESPWWAAPKPLTNEELACRRWIGGVTFGLPKERWAEQWNVGGRQFGPSSVRYHAAFLGYAAAALGMRTPAYPEWTRRALASLLEHMIDAHAWSYSDSYWGKDGAHADPCAQENVMYTGHLLHLLSLYEAMTGDQRYRVDGFDLRRDENTVFHYDTMTLVDTTVRQIRGNDSGGICCEPDLIFFPCNNHPHVALTMLRAMGCGDWSADTGKWEKWSLGNFNKSLGGGGVFSVLYHNKTKGFVPMGLAGGDAWSLLWYHAWATDPATPRAIWTDAARTYDWSWLSKNPSELSPLKFGCCGTLPIPHVITAAFLGAAARACGDATRADEIDGWVDTHYKAADASGNLFWNIPYEWRIATSANRIISLALKNGSDIRATTFHTLPRNYFSGPLLSHIEPEGGDVVQAYRRDDCLIVEIANAAKETILTLTNVDSVVDVEGVDRSQWSWEYPRLSLHAPARVPVVIHTLPTKK